MKKIIIALALIVCCLFPMRVMADAEDLAESAKTESAEEVSEYENVFETLFEKASDSLPEILSLLTLAASLILAFAYRRGLMPLLKGSLGAIADAMAHIKKKGDEGEGVLSSLDEAISSGFEKMGEVVNELSVRLDAMRSALDSAEERAGDREMLVKIINGQIDMLYDVFMSSSLPHFQKEAVGERIAEMREALRGDEGE